MDSPEQRTNLEKTSRALLIYCSILLLVCFNGIGITSAKSPLINLEIKNAAAIKWFLLAAILFYMGKLISQWIETYGVDLEDTERKRVCDLIEKTVLKEGERCVLNGCVGHGVSQEQVLNRIPGSKTYSYLSHSIKSLDDVLDVQNKYTVTLHTGWVPDSKITTLGGQDVRSMIRPGIPSTSEQRTLIQGDAAQAIAFEFSAPKLAQLYSKMYKKNITYLFSPNTYSAIIPVLIGALSFLVGLIV